jgi:hypothetical protein
MNLTADIKRQGYAADGDGEARLLPSRIVLQRYDIVDRTLDRWVIDSALGFPQPVIINRRRYWRDTELTAWERSLAKGDAAS